MCVTTVCVTQMMMSEGLTAKPEFMLKDRKRGPDIPDTSGAFLTTADELARRKKEGASASPYSSVSSAATTSTNTSTGSVSTSVAIHVAGFTVKNDRYGLGYDPVRDKKLFSEVRQLLGSTGTSRVSNAPQQSGHMTIGQSLRGGTRHISAFGLGALEEMEEDDIDDVYRQDESLLCITPLFLLQHVYHNCLVTQWISMIEKLENRQERVPECSLIPNEGVASPV